MNRSTLGWSRHRITFTWKGQQEHFTYQHTGSGIKVKLYWTQISQADLHHWVGVIQPCDGPKGIEDSLKLGEGQLHNVTGTIF